MIKKSLALMVVMVLLVAAIAGCSGGTKTENAQGVTDTQILVGTLAAQSGPIAPIGIPFVRGMESYFKMVNEEGGINGRTIKLVVKDDEYNPAKAIIMAEELVDTDQVFAIVGQLGTGNILATMETFVEAGIPCVYQGGGSVLFTTAGDNYFPVQPNYLTEGKIHAKYVVEVLKAETVVYIYQNDDTGQEGLKGFKEGLKHFGKESILVEEIAVNMTDVDFTTQVQLARVHDPDVVMIHTFLGPATGILKEAHKVGFETQFITQYAQSDATVILLAGDAAEGLLVTGWVDITRLEQYTQFEAAMTKYFPEQQINSFAVAGWIAAEVFVEGLRLAGENLSWEGFIAAMETMDFTEGLASRVKYGPNLRNGVAEMVFVQVVRNAEDKLVLELASDFIAVDWE